MPQAVDRVGVRGLRGGRQGAASNRRTALVEHAVSTLMVTPDDLWMLDEEAAANRDAAQEAAANRDAAKKAAARTSAGAGTRD